MRRCGRVLKIRAMTVRQGALIVLCWLTLHSTVAAQVSRTTESATAIAAAAQPAVVLVTALSADGDPLRSGSGFFVRDNGTLVTNYHVVEEAHGVEVKLATGEVFDNVFVLGTDPRRDIAILRIPTMPVPILHFSESDSLAVGERVYVVGNPMGLEGTFSEGIVSGHRLLEGTQLIQITAPISSGSSGGPVLDDKGDVIAIATLSFVEGQNLNLGVAARYVRSLLEMPSEPQRLEAGVVPSRVPEASTRTTGTFIRVDDPTGIYRLSLLDAATGGWWEGRVVIVPRDGRYFMAGWWHSDLHPPGRWEEFTSPVTVTADGRVAVEILTDLEGGFVSPDLIALAPVGTPVDDARNLVFLKSTSDNATISSPEGVYRVEGRGSFMDGRGEPIGWTGIVALLRTGHEHRSLLGKLTYLFFELRNSRGGGLSFGTTAALNEHGELAVDPGVWDRGERAATDHLRVSLRAGQIDITINREYHETQDQRLNRQIILVGGKIRP